MRITKIHYYLNYFLINYSKLTGNDLVFTKGIGNLINRVRRLVSQECIVIAYVDLVIDNRETINNLLKLITIIESYSGAKDRMVIVPIPCIEYYLVRSLVSEGLISIDDNLIETCVNFGDYTKYNIPKRYRSSFEKYCKYIVEEYGLMCIRNYTFNEYRIIQRKYFCVDCICTTDKMFDVCHYLSLKQKGVDLISEYPLVPRGSSLLDFGGVVLSQNGVKEKLKLLIDTHLTTIKTFGIHESELTIQQFRNTLNALTQLYNL